MTVLKISWHTTTTTFFFLSPIYSSTDSFSNFTVHRNNTRDFVFLTSSPLLSLFLSILSSSLSLALCVNGKVRSSAHSRVLNVTSPLLLFLQGRMLISSHWSLWATRWMDWWPRYSSRRICVKFQPWMTLFFDLWPEILWLYLFNFQCIMSAHVIQWTVLLVTKLYLLDLFFTEIQNFSELESFCWTDLMNTI